VVKVEAELLQSQTHHREVGGGSIDVPQGFAWRTSNLFHMMRFLGTTIAEREKPKARTHGTAWLVGTEALHSSMSCSLAKLPFMRSQQVGNHNLTVSASSISFSMPSCASLHSGLAPALRRTFTTSSRAGVHVRASV
jgi:hypothetical protein